jgi:hypothetical protein
MHVHTHVATCARRAEQLYVGYTFLEACPDGHMLNTFVLISPEVLSSGSRAATPAHTLSLTLFDLLCTPGAGQKAPLPPASAVLVDGVSRV